MDSKIAIRAENLYKSYRLYKKPKDRFKETFHPFRKKYHHDFFALNDISFEVKKGETVGIIGENGAGKSTLLKIIYNIVAPTSGNIVVNGNISALLEIGSGFNPEFTGIENIYFNGTIMGFSKEEMDKRIDDILSFADIGEFVYQPVKTYSTGMFMRLAFSVATCIDPEILVVDEALSVGDVFFQAKSINKMKNMVEEEGVTLLLVSHDLMSVKSICKKALFLKKGKMVGYGESNGIVEKYYSMKIKSEQEVITSEPGDKTDNNRENVLEKEHKAFGENTIFLEKAKHDRIQNGKASLANVQLLNENEETVFSIEYGQQLILRMAIEVHEDIDILDYGYTILNEDGVGVVHSDSVIEDKSLCDVKKGERYIVDWKIKASLTNLRGNYTVFTGLVIIADYENIIFEYCDRVPISVQFAMFPRPFFRLLGIVHLENELSVIRCR